MLSQTGLLELLAKEGGVIVSTKELTDVELAGLKVSNHASMFVDENGHGFVHMKNATYVVKGTRQDDLIRQVESLQLKLSAASKPGRSSDPQANFTPLKTRLGRS